MLESVIHSIDGLAARLGRTPAIAEHIATGLRGEEAAFFHLMRLGYVIVARQWRSPKRRGDLDLIGWDGEVLCFIEVKTRTTRAVAPAEAAVDDEKRKTLRRMAQQYLWGIEDGQSVETRFDIVSVYFERGKAMDIEVFRDAFRWSE